MMFGKRPLNISSAAFKKESHQIFAQMRQDQPVAKVRFTSWQTAYLITRYADVDAALRDPRFVKDTNNIKDKKSGNGMFWMPEAFKPLMDNMLNSDEPDHRRLRNLVHKAFTPRRIMELAPRIETIANDLLHNAKRSGQPFDLMQSYALPLPITVIAELVGIPLEEQDYFRRLSERIIVIPTPFNMIKAIPAVNRFFKYIRALAEKRRQNPQDDLLTALVQAEDDGDRFTENELLGMVFLLLVAGHETTVGLIANGAKALLENPDQWALLKEQPELIDSAVEELLRYDSPIETTEISFARETLTMHGVTIPQGAVVLPTLLSANRDETVFENADRLDITRTPNKHLSFGKGIHYCLGAPLARLEGKIAFGMLMAQMPNLRLAAPPEAIEYVPMPMIHRLKELLVTA